MGAVLSNRPCATCRTCVRLRRQRTQLRLRRGSNLQHGGEAHRYALYFCHALSVQDQKHYLLK